MIPHTYLDHGVTILQTRLSAPTHLAPTVHPPVLAPFLTLSRQTAAGATTIGQELLRQLNAARAADEPTWAFLDKDLLIRALSQHNLPERLAEFLPEDRVSEIDGVIGELVGLHPPLWELEQHVSHAILQLAKMGRVIFAGRASHLVTHDTPGGFHVRLIASRATRIARLARQDNLTAEAAADQIERHDQARRRYVKAHFDRDIDDPTTYDLVLNTDRLEPATAAAIIITGLNRHLDTARRAAAALPS